MIQAADQRRNVPPVEIGTRKLRPGILREGSDLDLERDLVLGRTLWPAEAGEEMHRAVNPLDEARSNSLGRSPCETLRTMCYDILHRCIQSRCHRAVRRLWPET